jgi:hypothetical protein
MIKQWKGFKIDVVAICCACIDSKDAASAAAEAGQRRMSCKHDGAVSLRQLAVMLPS